MELKMFDSKAMSFSRWVFSERVIFHNPCHVSVRTSSNLYSCAGISSKGIVGSVEEDNNIAVEPFHYHHITSMEQVVAGGGSVSSRLLGEISLLEAVDDEYGGVIVSPERLPTNPKVFASRLNSSISHWTREGKEGVWLNLPLDRSELVPLAVKEGFKYHHAEEGYLMLTYWIPDGPSMLPSNASHQVGVGAFVINDKNEVLVVQEKHYVPAYPGHWKIPTGFIHASEDIYCGAVREVKEETGIDSEFVEIIAFRHAHKVAFEKSDLFFVCMLRPISTDIIIDDPEILDAKWMPLVDFTEQPLYQEGKMFKKIIKICIARLEKLYFGLSSEKLMSKFDGKLSSLYYNVLEDQDYFQGI